jgi:phosphoserine phosphatase
LVTGSGWKRVGEDFQFDLFRGNRIHATELLKSPLEEGGHSVLWEFSHLYIGILNDYDLIVSKLMRGSTVDFEDCLSLTEAHLTIIDMGRLISHFYEMISYDVSEERIRPNMDHLLQLLREKGLYD